MENPVQEIPGVIGVLTQGAPEQQLMAIRKYFVPDAGFIHPFCRVERGANSRWWIEKIYRWYKILSPRIELDVQSVAYDEQNLILYVSLHQLFKIWAIPFQSSPVDLVTKLELVKYTPPASQTDSYAAAAATNGDKPHESYFIKSQNDLYQVNEFVKFFSLLRIVWAGVFIWQWVATLFCAIGTYVFWPVTWVEQKAVGRDGSNAHITPKEVAEGLLGEAMMTGNMIMGKIGKSADQSANERRKKQR